MNQLKVFITALFCVFLTQAHSQQVVGADINYHVSGANTYTCSLVVFSYQPIDTAFFDGGSGIYDTIIINQSVIGGLYSGWTSVTHTFPGPGTYTVRAKVPYWIPSITNMTASHTQMVELTGSIIISPLIPASSSAHWGYSPEMVSTTGNTFIHDPGYWPIDGDSMAFSIVPVNAAGYLLPSQMGGSEAMNAVSQGILSVTPAASGLYAIGIRITEFKEVSPGQFLQFGHVERVMVIDATTMGVSEADEHTWTIYPNPSADFINLPADATYDVLVFDAAGKLVLQQQKITSQLNVRNFSAGNYTVRIMNNANGNWLTGKFVKE